MTIYCIAAHVFAKYINGQIVFLDTKNDQYSALEAEVSGYLKGLDTAGAVQIENLCPSVSDQVLKTLNDLHKAGIVEIRSAMPANRPKMDFLCPNRDINSSRFVGKSKFDIQVFVKFVVACILSVFGLKILGLYRLVKIMPGNNNATKVQDERSASDLEDIVIKFRVVRSLFYTARDHCYFDCAVMMIFLKFYGYQPRWIFAVKMNPFAAHCWVQVGSVLVSDYLRGTDHFTPIMVI